MMLSSNLAADKEFEIEKRMIYFVKTLIYQSLTYYSIVSN